MNNKLAEMLKVEFEINEQFDVAEIDPTTQNFELEEGASCVLFFTYKTYRKFFRNLDQPMSAAEERKLIKSLTQTEYQDYSNCTFEEKREYLKAKKCMHSKEKALSGLYNNEREIQIVIKAKSGKLIEGIVVKVQPVSAVIN